MNFRLIAQVTVVLMVLGLSGCAAPKVYESSAPLEETTFAAFVEGLKGTPKGAPVFDPGFDKDVLAPSGWTLSAAEDVEVAFRKFADEQFSKWCSAHGGEYSFWSWRTSSFGSRDLASIHRNAKLAIPTAALGKHAVSFRAVAQCLASDGPYLVAAIRMLPGGALSQDKIKTTFFNRHGLDSIARDYAEEQADTARRLEADAARREEQARQKAHRRQQFQEGLKAGSQAKQGLVVEVKQPLALVQRCVSYTVGVGCTQTSVAWMPIKDLSPVN